LIFDQSDLILPTLRAVAFDAHRVREIEPTKDQTGLAYLYREERAAAAVGLIQGHFVMKTYNQRCAQDNTRLLRREIDEHKIQLHAIWSQVSEAQIRLFLGDQLAFHKTGWTQEDIQALVQAVQAAFVAKIAIQ